MDIPAISFGLGVADTDLAQIKISPIVLTNGMNHFNLALDVIFAQAAKDDLALSNALGRIIGGEALAVNGPISLEHAAFAGQMSSGLAIRKCFL